MRKLVVGDLHGAYKPLLQVLDRCQFNPSEDQLIFIGDILDGYSDIKECIDFIKELPNKIIVKGNHDEWVEHIVNYKSDVSSIVEAWMPHGGFSTYTSLRDYMYTKEFMDFINSMKMYHVDEDKLFVHAGLSREKSYENNNSETLMWDRNFIEKARNAHFYKNYSKLRLPKNPEIRRVFVGHTPTINMNDVFRKHDEPALYVDNFKNGVINVDTGSCFSGKLTVMDTETLEYWQSDVCNKFYEKEHSRANPPSREEILDYCKDFVKFHNFQTSK